MKTYTLICLFILASIAGLNCSKESASLGNFSPAAGQGGSMARFAIAGNYLYTVDKENLKVYSLASPADPVLMNTVHAGFEIETIFPLGDKLFLGSTSVIHIFSISNPSNPQKLSTAISPTVMRRCDPVVAKDSVAWATLRTNGPCGGIESRLATFDIRDISNPVQTSATLINEPYGLGYSDTTLYVCDRNALYLYSINNAYHPSFLKSVGVGNWFMDVIPYGNTLICWVSDGVILYDISNRVFPQFIAKII